jgi:hypothetical protein
MENNESKNATGGWFKCVNMSGAQYREFGSGKRRFATFGQRVNSADNLDGRFGWEKTIKSLGTDSESVEVALNEAEEKILMQAQEVVAISSELNALKAQLNSGQFVPIADVKKLVSDIVKKSVNEAVAKALGGIDGKSSCKEQKKGSVGDTSETISPEEKDIGPNSEDQDAVDGCPPEVDDDQEQEEKESSDGIF